MTAKKLLDALLELTPSQLKLPVLIETEFITMNDSGSDEYHDIEEPATSVRWTDKFVIIKAK